MWNMQLSSLTGNSIRLSPFRRVETQLSKYNVEATGKKPMVRIEELAELRVRGISAKVARIEMIGRVEYSERQPHAILLCQLKLFRHFRVE